MKNYKTILKPVRTTTRDRERERERERRGVAAASSRPASRHWSHSLPHRAVESTLRPRSTTTTPSVIPCMIAETSFRPLVCPAFLRAPRLHTTRHLLWPLGVLGDGDMASIPQTLQLTKAAQKQQRNGGGNSASIGSYCGMAETDQPARYNSKLMNSIWGRYNEHSVHNFKSLQCGVMAGAGAQSGLEVGQAMMQPPSPSLSSGAMKRRMRELGEAVSANFMDNLNQY